ncbi:Hypothetical predicted protein [Lecanosticta acicola]|uniref:Uncharacterized protein n=1 Tax=Lecanosticta acicola TaxID=111012 RepID=A0AAI8Z8H8_9PEZI|nr:Hypothetical predicted protein [Lecanosticta acicola]
MSSWLTLCMLQMWKLPARLQNPKFRQTCTMPCTPVKVPEHLAFRQPPASPKKRVSSGRTRRVEELESLAGRVDDIEARMLVSQELVHQVHQGMDVIRGDIEFLQANAARVKAIVETAQAGELDRARQMKMDEPVASSSRMWKKRKREDECGSSLVTPPASEEREREREREQTRKKRKSTSKSRTKGKSERAADSYPSRPAHIVSDPSSSDDNASCASVQVHIPRPSRGKHTSFGADEGATSEGNE